MEVDGMCVLTSRFFPSSATWYTTRYIVWGTAFGIGPAPQLVDVWYARDFYGSPFG